jgi:hypothetical protein
VSTPQKLSLPQFDCTVGGLEQVSHTISDDESDETTSDIVIKKVKKRTYFFWTLMEVFENEDLAYEKFLDQNIWKFKQNTQSNDGDKSFFKCHENKQCKAGLQFLYVNKNMTVSVFTNNIDHDHTWADETIWGISKKIKLVINDLYDSGVIKPQLIMYELRRRAVDEPTLKQLENYLRVYKCKKHGKTEISYYDLDMWCSKRTKIPDDLHEVFVIGYEIIIDEIDSSKVSFEYL